MRRAISVSLGILVAFTASTVLAGGALKIEFTGIPPENLKNVRVEVLESNGKKAKVAFRDDAMNHNASRHERGNPMKRTLWVLTVWFALHPTSLQAADVLVDHVEYVRETGVAQEMSLFFPG